MKQLTCDICFGTLVVQSGGQFCRCSCCGVEYSLDRMREKVRELNGGVTNGSLMSVASSDFEIRGGVLKAYHGNDSHVVIPPTVVEIGKEAFRECPGIQSVVIPEGVTIIREYAFSDCKNLRDVALPDSLLKIDNDVFSGCESLEGVVLPKSIKEIGFDAFHGCTALKSINLPDSLTCLRGGAFFGCLSLFDITMSEHRKAALYREEIECYRAHSQRESWIHILWKQTDYNVTWKYYPEGASPWYLEYRRTVEELKRQEDEKMREEDEVRKSTALARRKRGVCQHCGGVFSGIIKLTCSVCGKRKDY